MLLAEKKMEYEHIVQISSSKNETSQTPSSSLEGGSTRSTYSWRRQFRAFDLANFDNSFFQALPADPDAMASMKSSLDKTVRFGH